MSRVVAELRAVHLIEPAHVADDVAAQLDAGAVVVHGPGSTVSLRFTRSRSGSRLAPMAHRFTIGVEEEFQIVDPNTWEFRSHV